MASSASTFPPSSPPRKVITFKCSEGGLVDIEESVITSQSMIIATLIEQGWSQDPIPLSRFSKETILKVVEYCNKHHSLGLNDNDLQEWDAKFIDMDSYKPVFDIILAADYLEINNLCDLGRKAAANMMAKRCEEIQQMPGKPNDIGQETNP